jgi:hypothetical protein
MSQGKYSPTAYYDKTVREFIYNAKGEVPAPWNTEVAASGVKYDEETMFGDYDSEGFDGYGYSAYDEDGTFVGLGQGVDRIGYTEHEYLCMSADDFEAAQERAGDHMLALRKNKAHA